MPDDDLRPEPPKEPDIKDNEDYIARAVVRADEIKALLIAAQVPPGPITTLALTMLSASNSQAGGLSVIDGIRVYIETYEQAELSFAQRVHREMFSTLNETVGRALKNTTQ